MTFFNEKRLVWFMKWVLLPVVILDVLAVTYETIWFLVLR